MVNFIWGNRRKRFLKGGPPSEGPEGGEASRERAGGRVCSGGVKLGRITPGVPGGRRGGVRLLSEKVLKSC